MSPLETSRCRRQSIRRFNFLMRAGSYAVLVFCLLSAAPARAVQPTDADVAFTSLNKIFWDPQTKFFRRSETNSAKANFWLESQLWDTVMDQYDRTHSDVVKRQIDDVYDGFNKIFPDWTTNRFNDDIMWWAIGCTRAFTITHEDRYLKKAKASFDSVYDNYLDSTLGGGLYWVKQRTSKNSCLNSPAVIAAVRLSVLLNDPTYLQKAKSLYDWQKKTLTDGKGKVFDNIRYDAAQQTTRLERVSYTYNEGTFIGAGVLLYQQTKNQVYLDDAIEAAQWSKDNICVGDERILPNEGQGDGGAFKGIFIRYMKLLIDDSGRREFLPWMKANAESAWRHRRPADNIMGSDWSSVTEKNIQCQTDASAVAAVLDFADDRSKP